MLDDGINLYDLFMNKSSGFKTSKDAILVEFDNNEFECLNTK